MTELLGIYLQDHETAATAATRRFRRVAETHTDLAIRAAVALLADEVEADHQELVDIMAVLGHEPSRAKQLGAVAAEAVGALKPNGRVVSRSPLTDVVELEALTLAVTGKRLGWELLLLRPAIARRIGEDRLQRLIERAQTQAEQLDRLRLACADPVLEDGETNPSDELPVPVASSGLDQAPTDPDEPTNSA